VGTAALIPAADTELDLVIDPGQAFGTGAHATTALCLGMLLDLPLGRDDDRSVLDLGCGSGVLGILAARLGWGPVLAVDFDPLAVEATRKNASVNGVVLDGVRRFDLFGEEPVPAARLVLANLLAPLLLAWCERGVAAETVVASGLLISEADRISLAFARLGYTEEDRRTQGDWAALLLSAKFL
jgi:ribosomal protein L11 methyltransferase